jgi:putative copper export protein
MLERIDALNKWLMTTDLSHAIAGRQPWIWPMCETLHFVGLAILIGCIGVLDLRMLGFVKGMSIQSIHRFVPWGIFGFAINAVTGALFYIGAPFQYAHNFAFLMKLLFMLIAGLNVMYFYWGGVLRKLEAMGPEADPPLSAKLVSIVSIVMWFGVLYWGRMLPFVGNAF